MKPETGALLFSGAVLVISLMFALNTHLPRDRVQWRNASNSYHQPRQWRHQVELRKGSYVTEKGIRILTVDISDEWSGSFWVLGEDTTRVFPNATGCDETVVHLKTGSVIIFDDENKPNVIITLSGAATFQYR